MRYLAYTDDGEYVHQVNVKIRSDARIRTVYEKLAVAVVRELRRNGKHRQDVFEIHMDLPNVWRNGGVGSVWMTAGNDLYDVYASREGEPWL